MQETLRVLLGLQEIDRQIFGVERELARLPRELAQRREGLDQKAAELDGLNERVRTLRAGLKEIEDMTTQARQRVRKLEGESQKSKSDVALLAAYDHEIRSLKRRISQDEEDGLQIVEEIEGVEREIGERREQLSAARTVFEEYRENVANETNQAEERLARLRSDLETRTSGQIPPNYLTLYRSLLARREGEALAELDGQFCQGCYVEIPKNLAVRLARGIELVQCPSCDRILYVRT